MEKDPNPSKENIQRGEIVRHRVDNSMVRITDLSRKLKVSRSTLYNYFNGKTEMSSELILKIGKIINYDFTIDFPWFNPNAVKLDNYLMEPETAYEKAADFEQKYNLCRREKEILNQKYVETLETLGKFKEMYYKLAIKTGQSAD